MSWKDNSANESNFVIQYSVDGGVNWRSLKFMAANSTFATLAGINAALIYSLRIRAQNSGGASGWASGTFSPSSGALMASDRADAVFASPWESDDVDFIVK